MSDKIKNSIPRHIAIIMDGNGRWAKNRLLPRLAGHKAGAKAVERTLQAAQKTGVEFLTLYAFSTENWTRPQEEINGLKDMVNDPEIAAMAKMELEANESRKEELIKEIEILLIPKDENDGKDIIMEIRGAAGGDEANIFAGDLFRMYSYYAEKNGCRIDLNKS